MFFRTTRDELVTSVTSLETAMLTWDGILLAFNTIISIMTIASLSPQEQMTLVDDLGVQSNRGGSRLTAMVASYSRKLAGSFRDPNMILLTIPFIVYSCVWSYIGIAKFYALKSSVYDLGISMQTAYMIFNNSWTLHAFVTFILIRNGLAVFMSPVGLLADYPLMITIQAVFVGASVFPIYGISIRSGLGKFESLLISISYLIFYPLDGLVWFDFHYQMFFVFLFLLAYYLYMRGMLRSSFAVFCLSGFTRYPFMLFPFLFALLLLIEFSVKRYLGKPVKNQTLLFSTTLMIITASILVSGYLLIGGISSVPLHTGSSAGASYTSYAKWFTLFMLLAPLLFIPILSYRWYLLELPFLFLLFSSSSGTYSYPQLFLRQYSSGIVPFLYLGLIDGLNNLQRLSERIKDKIKGIHRTVSRNKPTKNRTGHPTKLSVKRSAVLAIIVILASASFFYQPYGPFNHLTKSDFHLADATDVNMTIFKSLQRVLSIIPKSESHVLIQNNIVLALPGPIGKILLVPQYDVGPNISISNIQNNSFPYKEGNVVGKTPIDYAIADVNDQNTLLQHGLVDFPSMLELCQELISSGYYGIRAEQNNILLLQRGYTGPVSFVPLKSTYKASEFRAHSGNLTNGILEITNPPSGPAMWYGPFTNPYVDYLSLSPGSYDVTFVIATDNNAQTNNLRLTVESSGGSAILNYTTITGGDIASVRAWTDISLNFTLYNLASHIELDSLTGIWNGTVFLKQIELIQTSSLPPGEVGPIVGMPGIQVPQGTSVNASSYIGNYSPGNSIDGSLLTAWISGSYTGVLTLDFPRKMALIGLGLATGSNPPGNFTITIEGFNASWTTLFSGQRFVGGGSTGFTVLTFLFAKLQCADLRITCTSGHSLIRINEITLELAA